MIDITAQVNLSALQGLEQKIQDAAALVVRKTAFKIEADAKQLAPVDTGALRASIFTVTTTASGRGGAMASAVILRPGASAARFDQSPSPYEAFVVVGVEYGIYQEFGSGGRPGRFYLTRAGTQNRDWFRAELSEALRS